MRIFLTHTAVLLVLLASCQSSPRILKDNVQEFKEGDFLGIVYDSRNRPCQGAVIIVDGKSKRTYRTDINGRFVITGLSRGEHLISVSKPGYEGQEIELDYTSRKQVLYTQLVSLDTLLDDAEAALDSLDWMKTQHYLDRAQKIEEDNSRLLAFQGALAFQTGQYAKALGFWNRLLDKGHKDSYLYLLIADTYQYGIGDDDAAIQWLELYLQSRSDESVRKRKEELVNSRASQP